MYAAASTPAVCVDVAGTPSCVDDDAVRCAAVVLRTTTCGGAPLRAVMTCRASAASAVAANRQNKGALSNCSNTTHHNRWRSTHQHVMACIARCGEAIEVCVTQPPLHLANLHRTGQTDQYIQQQQACEH